MEPVRTHVIGCAELTIHVSAPLGEVSVKAPFILKLLFDTSNAVASLTSEMRTFTCVEIASGIVHEYVPELATEAAMTLLNVAPSVQYSSLTFGTEPTLVHAISVEPLTV
jgi:hypothetical protein